MKFVDQYGREVSTAAPERMMYYAGSKDIKICIHQIRGCGVTWYLSCHKMRISDRDLNTENFDEAVMRAQNIIHDEASGLMTAAAKFWLDGTPFE